MTTPTWTTARLTNPPGALIHTAHLTQTGDDDTARALCTPYLVFPDPRQPRKGHGKCVGCLTATAETSTWSVTDLQILREIADPWILAGLITTPAATAKQVLAQRPGARAHGSGYAWARDGIRIWRNKQPGNNVIDDHTPDRILTWAAINAHAKKHSTPEQSWWLTELDAWRRTWWTDQLATERQTTRAQAHRSHRAMDYIHAIAYPTWADTTLTEAPVQLDLLDFLETTR